MNKNSSFLNITSKYYYHSYLSLAFKTKNVSLSPSSNQIKKTNKKPSKFTIIKKNTTRQRRYKNIFNYVIYSNYPSHRILANVKRKKVSPNIKTATSWRLLGKFFWYHSLDLSIDSRNNHTPVNTIEQVCHTTISNTNIV